MIDNSSNWSGSNYSSVVPPKTVMIGFVGLSPIGDGVMLDFHEVNEDSLINDGPVVLREPTIAILLCMKYLDLGNPDSGYVLPSNLPMQGGSVDGEFGDTSAEGDEEQENSLKERIARCMDTLEILKQKWPFDYERASQTIRNKEDAAYAISETPTEIRGVLAPKGSRGFSRIISPYKMNMAAALPPQDGDDVSILAKLLGIGSSHRSTEKEKIIPPPV